LPDKATKFDHAHLSKFASGAIDPRSGEPFDPTLDLIDALCEEFRLPRPVHFARTFNEAIEQMRIAEHYDKKMPLELAEEAEVTPFPKPDERKRRKRTAHTAATTHATKRKTRSA
jgi:hypothetical protein